MLDRPAMVYDGPARRSKKRGASLMHANILHKFEKLYLEMTCSLHWPDRTGDGRVHKLRTDITTRHPQIQKTCIRTGKQLILAKAFKNVHTDIISFHMI